MPRSGEHPAPAAAPYRPAWLRHVPFLVHPPLLTQQQWHMLLPITAAGLVACTFPETSGRTLEDIVPER